jgi:hypothetical protein
MSGLTEGLEDYLEATLLEERERRVVRTKDLAKRLGVTLNYFGVDIDMETPPTDDLFLSILASRGNVPFEELKEVAVGGRIFEGLPEVVVLPPAPHHQGQTLSTCCFGTPMHQLDMTGARRLPRSVQNQ